MDSRGGVTTRTSSRLIPHGRRNERYFVKSDSYTCGRFDKLFEMVVINKEYNEHKQYMKLPTREILTYIYIYVCVTEYFLSAHGATL